MSKYDFECECGNVFTKNVEMGMKETECECGKIAQKIFNMHMPHVRWRCGGNVGNNDISKG